MLVLIRKGGETFYLQLSDDADPNMPIGDVLKKPIAIHILKEVKGQMRIGIEAPEAMKWSQRAMSESFLLSNMAPQKGAGFNRGIWRSLETKIRKWTKARGELYVVTGPIYKSTAKKIGQNKVTVPTHFYKVVFDPVKVEAIAFILPNKKNKSKDLHKFIVSVDKVESDTGLDFLSNLNSNIEKITERKVQPSLW